MADWGHDVEASDENESAVALPAFAGDPFGVLRRRWPWMLLCVAVGLGLTAQAVWSRKPMYQATTTILISSQAIPEEFVQSTVVENSLSHINAIVGQVLSRQNLAGLVEKYGLYAELRDKTPLAEIVDGMRGAIEIFPQESVGSSRGSGSEVFVINYQNADRELAAKVANELAAFFTAANIEMRNRQAQLTTDFLRRELERSEAELRNQERRITEFSQTYRGGLPGELQANISRLERLQSQRQSLASQTEAVESRLMLLKAQPEPDTAGATPRSLLSDLKTQLERELVVLTDEHPNVIALQRRIERLESDVVQEEAKAVVSPRALQISAEQRQLTMMRGQLLEIESEMRKLEGQVQATPMRQEEFAALEQRAIVLRENYLGFLRKVQEAELAQSLESAQHGARISVLDRASPPDREINPHWKLMSIGVVGSFGLAAGLAVLLELLDAVVVGRKQLEALSDRPLLGSVPRIA